MYKVFFNDRTVFITGVDNLSNIENSKIIKYNDQKELERSLNLFIEDANINNLVFTDKDQSAVWKEFQKFFKVIHAAGGLVQNQDGDLLVIHRLGLPDLPKGKVEKGENYEITAVREVEEECGLRNVEILTPITTTFHTYQLNGRWILKHTHWYDMRYAGLDKLVPQEIENITDVKWVARENVANEMNQTYKSLKDLLKYAGWI